jgi:hypothetical protein
MEAMYMATTAGTVFDITMALIDELRERDGASDTVDTLDYRNRTLPLISVLGGELYPYSDTYCATAGLRPIFDPPTAFTDSVGLDDFLCRSVLPYGLAALLLFDENPGAAAVFRQRFDVAVSRYGGAVPAVSEPIEDLYGGVNAPEGGE